MPVLSSRQVILVTVAILLSSSSAYPGFWFGAGAEIQELSGGFSPDIASPFKVEEPNSGSRRAARAGLVALGCLVVVIGVAAVASYKMEMLKAWIYGLGGVCRGVRRYVASDMLPLLVLRIDHNF